MGLRELFPDGGKTWLPGVNYIGWRAYLIVAMADLVIGCHEGDVALSKQLIGDLPVERLLFGLLLRRSLRLDRQEEVGPLLCELPKNACCVWSASAWISTPSRSSSPSSFWSTERS